MNNLSVEQKEVHEEDKVVGLHTPVIIQQFVHCLSNALLLSTIQNENTSVKLLQVLIKP